MSQITESPASRHALLGSALGLGGALALASNGAAGAASVPSDPSSDFFLSIPTIPGDSRDQVMRGTIDVLAWSFGVSSTTVAATSGGLSPAKSKPTSLTFVSRESRASPKLFIACATGRRLSSVTLTARHNLEVPVVYLTVKLENVVVSSYQVAPSDTDGYPLEVVRLDYVKLTTTYTPQNADGSLGTPVTAGFDYDRNVAF